MRGGGNYFGFQFEKKKIILGIFLLRAIPGILFYTNTDRHSVTFIKGYIFVTLGFLSVHKFFYQIFLRTFIGTSVCNMRYLFRLVIFTLEESWLRRYKQFPGIGDSRQISDVNHSTPTYSILTRYFKPKINLFQLGLD